METLLASLISAASAICVCLVSSHYQLKNTRAQHNETITLVEYKLDELTKRVDKHNNVVERTYELEKKCEILEHEMEMLKAKEE